MAAALRFLGGGIPDASLLPDFTLAATLPAPSLSSLLDLSCAYLSAADAAQLQSALEGLSQRHGLRAKPARGVARAFALALGGAVKFGLVPEALCADMKALGSFWFALAPFPLARSSHPLPTLHTHTFPPRPPLPAPKASTTLARRRWRRTTRRGARRCPRWRRTRRLTRARC